MEQFYNSTFEQLYWRKTTIIIYLNEQYIIIIIMDFHTQERTFSQLTTQKLTRLKTNKTQNSVMLVWYFLPVKKTI